MKATFDNAVHRIIKKTFEGVASVIVKNSFDYGTSGHFTNFLAHNYTAVVTLESNTPLKNSKGLSYSFNSIDIAKNEIMLVNDHTGKLLKQLEDESISKTLADVCSFYKPYHDFIQNLLPSEDQDALYEHVSDLQFANSPSFLVDRLCRPNWSKVELEAKK
jgi:hypothetical protein